MRWLESRGYAVKDRWNNAQDSQARTKDRNSKRERRLSLGKELGVARAISCTDEEGGRDRAPRPFRVDGSYPSVRPRRGVAGAGIVRRAENTAQAACLDHRQPPRSDPGRRPKPSFLLLTAFRPRPPLRPPSILSSTLRRRRSRRRRRRRRRRHRRRVSPHQPFSTSPSSPFG